MKSIAKIVKEYETSIDKLMHDISMAALTIRGNLVNIADAETPEEREKWINNVLVDITLIEEKSLSVSHGYYDKGDEK